MPIPIPVYVRYECLRPQQIVARRSACPVAYVPLGTLEWHGEHNPVGLDALKAHALCCVMAERIGGLAMPPLWWGDNRDDICEVVFGPHRIKAIPLDHTPRIADKMGLPAEAFHKGGVLPPDLGWASPTHQPANSPTRDNWSFFQALVERILCQLQTLGFKAAILLCGHYPERAPAQRAIERYAAQGTLKAFAMTEVDLLREAGYSGDHAARWETSLLMAFYPELVDIAKLGDNISEPPIGVLGADPRGTASAEYGVEGVNAIVESVRKKVAELMAW